MDENSKTVYLSDSAVQRIREQYYAKFHVKHVRADATIAFKMIMLLGLIVLLAGVILATNMISVKDVFDMIYSLMAL